MRRWAFGIVVVLALLAGLGVQRYQRMQRQQHEEDVAALRSMLAEMRGAIAKYREDNGRHPRSLEELVPKYLRSIPVDPFTQSMNWRVTTEESVTPSEDFTPGGAPKSETVIVNVHSSAPGYADY